MSEEQKCIQCGNLLPPLKTNKDGSEYKYHTLKRKYCSSICRLAFEKQKYRAFNPFRGTTRPTTGAISELRVSVDLLSRGYNVFRALSPACPCDLAVLKNNKLLRIEVRTTYIFQSGKLYKAKNKKDDKDNIDIYAWVLPDKILYEPDLQ